MLKILVPLDSSSVAEAAVSEALAVGRAFDSEIHLVRVLDTHPTSHSAPSRSCRDWDLRRREALSYLIGVQQRIPAQHQHRVTVTAVLEGNAAIELLNYADQHAIDMIVMAEFGESGGQPFPHGGVTLKLLSQIDASVLLVNPKRRRLDADDDTVSSIPVARYRNVTVAVDATRAAEAALQLGIALAQAHSATLTLLDSVVPIRLPDRLADEPDVRRLAQRLDSQIVTQTRRLLTGLIAQVPPDVVVTSTDTNNRGGTIDRVAGEAAGLVILASTTPERRMAAIRGLDSSIAEHCPLLFVAADPANESIHRFRSTLLPPERTTTALRTG